MDATAANAASSLNGRHVKANGGAPSFSFLWPGWGEGQNFIDALLASSFNLHYRITNPARIHHALSPPSERHNPAQPAKGIYDNDVSLGHWLELTLTSVYNSKL